MTNLEERQPDKVRGAATGVLVLIYIMLLVLLGCSGRLPTGLSKYVCAIVNALLFLPFSQPIFFLLFSPKKEPLGDKYLLLGRIIGLVKQVISLVMFFAGGYFGWLISSQLDGLSDKLSALDKAYANKGISLDEGKTAVRQTIFDIQNFISDQADLIFSFMSLIIAGWLCLLAVDLIRGYTDGDLMSSFRVFDLNVNELLAPAYGKGGRFIRLISSQAYFYYRKIADFIAKLSFIGFFIYLFVFFAFAYAALDGSLQEIHDQFNKWLFEQMNRLCELTLSGQECIV